MATVKQIVEADGSVRYDFLGSSRLWIEEDSHTSEEARDGVSQIFNLIISDTQDNIRDAVVELEHRLEQAIYWHRQNSTFRSLWWNMQSEGESAKRSLITGYSLRPLTDNIQNPHTLQSSKTTARYRCVITHRAEFEETAADNYATGTSPNLGGGQWAPGVDAAKATFDHRISHIKLTPSTQIEKWWIGIRPLWYIGETALSFDAEAYFTSGVAIDSDSAIIDDSSNGALGTAPNTARTSFATDATMINRAYKLLYTPSAVASMRGRYTVLARFRLTNPSTTRVGFRIGMSFRTPGSKYFTADWQQSRYFGMSSNYTNYTLAEIGEIQIPPAPYRYDMAIEPVEFNEYINMAAERIEGTGQLYFNGFILMPADHQIICENGIATSAIPLHIFTHEDFAIDAFAVQASNDEVQSRFEVTPRNWRFPRYGGIMVFAGQTDTSHVKTATVAADMDVYRTWRLYRV